MPPQEKLPAQDNRPQEDVLSQEDIKTSSGSETTSDVAENSIPYHETVSADRIPQITATNSIKTHTQGDGEEVDLPTSTWAAVKLKMSRQSSLNITMGQMPQEENAEKSPPPQLPNVPDPEDKQPSMDFDEMLPHVGEFGLYQKLLFVLLAPFAFFVAFVYFTQIFITVTPEEYWCKVPELELLNLTAEQR